MAYKQVILVRKDLNLPKGKLASQVGHAVAATISRTKKEVLERWASEGMKKIVLKVKDLDELKEYQKTAKQSGLVAELISDAGHTTVEPGTVTCLGIGPDEEEKIDKVTGKLKML